jgi:hypothetical protein
MSLLAVDHLGMLRVDGGQRNQPEARSEQALDHMVMQVACDARAFLDDSELFGFARELSHSRLPSSIVSFSSVYALRDPFAEMRIFPGGARGDHYADRESRLSGQLHISTQTGGPSN